MIYVLPWGNRDIASSRLRIYNIASYLDYEFELPQEYTKDDILIIQKTPNYHELKKAKKQGAKVIYDIDDWYDSEQYQKMLNNADLVTVDNEYKKKLFDKAVVIPDTLDWNGKIKISYTDGKLMGWTGYGNNSKYLNPAYLPLKRQGYKIRLITTPDYTSHFAGVCEFVQWSRQTVDEYLSECDYGVIALSDNDFAQSKGEHKLLKNWAIGLPTYATPIPSYKRAVEKAGVSKNCLVDDWNNLKPIKFEPAMREYALQYTPQNVAKIWKKYVY